MFRTFSGFVVVLVATLSVLGLERPKAITNANPTTEQPWSVGLRFSNGDGCSGISISQHWIVTSGHCLRGKSYQTHTVEVYRNEKATGLIYSGRASYYNHPHYDPGPFGGDRGDDIGLVRLRDDGMVPDLTARIYHGPPISPPPLAPPSHKSRGAVVFVAGYGPGTNAGGSKNCDDAKDSAKKRIGRLTLSGNMDDNGTLGFGNAIAVEGHTHMACLRRA
jgi:hypothetical protein